MLTSTRGRRGMAVAPHALASQSALDVLREGGNAIEAMIAAAATIAVVYPHMNAIGGDSFWVVHNPGKAPGGVGARGGGLGRARAVSGWGAPTLRSRRTLKGRIPLKRLLADAIYYAENGIPVTPSQASST